MGEASAVKSEAEGFTSPDSGLTVPRIFGRLLLLKLLARGGMGDVYLAATTGIEGAETACVVKTVRRDHIHDGSFLARFLDEARVQAQLNHPGVAQVLEASTDENGEPYTVVEHIEGRSLSEVRQRAVQLGIKIGWPEALALTIEMAQALAHVHERTGADGKPLGIVHRDLSPQNVMVGYAGEVKLIDFGTARGQNRRCHTVAGVVFAKPGYVAPEVARQQVGDARIDIYALGIMLWELCAGKRFLNTDPQKHLEDAAQDRVVIPEIAKSIGAPPLLDEVIARLTKNDPEQRYTNAGIAARDMVRVLMEAPAIKGERGVRARAQGLMKQLWTQEPHRSRAEFARLLAYARELVKENETPSSGLTSGVMAKGMNDEHLLSGTPYRLIRKIGEGASGQVYEAEHVELGRKLAVKVLAPEQTAAADAIERFRREARVLAKLEHPNLCHLYDFGKSLDGRIFLAMELLVGETLDKRMRRTRGMDWREAVGLAIEVTRALDVAHGAGLVHRDLKPANLFLTKTGRVKLLDFGVAMAMSETKTEEKKQKGFAVFGTPEYMAPEQVAGEQVDGRCDLYSLGSVLYELLTGRTPFEGKSSVEVMGKQLRELPDPPMSRMPNKGIPREVDAIVMNALAKRPENRFASAEEMRNALESTLVISKTRANATKGIVAATMVGALLLLGAGMHKQTRWSWSDARALGDRAKLAWSAPPPAAPVTLTAATIPAAELPPEPVAPVATIDAVEPAEIATVDVPYADLKPGADSKLLAPLAKASKIEEPKASIKHEVKAERSPLSLADARTEAKARPSEPDVLRTWAQAALAANDLREARRAANSWILHDGTPEPRIFLAKVLDASKRRNDAKAVLEEVLELFPDSHEARELHAKLGAPLPPSETRSAARGLARK